MSAPVKIVEVHAHGSYRVSIGSGILKNCGSAVAALTAPCRIAVITDSTVAPLYLKTVKDSLERAGFTVCSFVYSAGESSKNLGTLSDILEFLAGQELTRTDCVAALGGGVCGDMAGFAAGCYLRGIRYIQLPTTLLAAVDSSVGGKTAVDLRTGKNLAGVFHQPAAVLCDTDCLQTLPEEIFADGVAEALKTGVLADESLFSLFETGDLSLRLPEIIARCVAFKAQVVEADEFDMGIRRTLNLGHTVGHAIEKCSDYTIPHGHAVAVGMVVIARAAERLDWCAESCSARITSTLSRNGLPISTGYSARELAAAALLDKKRVGGSITLVVPAHIGKCDLKTIPVAELESVIAAGLDG